jgi:hypothetical protein
MSAARSSVLAILVIALVAGLVPAIASSADKNSTKIVLSLKFPAFHGKLTSPRKGCLGSRQVKMYRERYGKTKLLGRDESADNGKWSIPVGNALTSGSYYAKVAKRGRCKAAKSKLVTID